MKKFMHDMMTGIDGDTYDLWRVVTGAGALAIIAAFGVLIWGGVSAIVGHRFVYQDFAGATATLLAGFTTFVLGTAGAIWAKRQTEPSLVTATKTDPAGNTSTASVETGAP